MRFTFLMPHWFPPWNATLLIHMADSASGQDKTNPVFLLATRAGMMIARDICVGPARKSYLFVHVWKRLLTKRIRSRWLDFGLTLFCVFIDLDNAKKNSWPISSHVDRILLVNNAYRNTDGFHGFLFLSCKETVLRGCVVFSQTWMNSNNLLSPYPPLPDILSLPYIRPVLS